MSSKVDRWLAAASALALVLVFVWLYFGRHPVLHALTREGAVIEQLTFALFLVAAGALAAAGAFRSTSRWWLFALALACFVIAGEEISWGQRVVGFETPEALAQVNVQDETSLHNIEGVHGLYGIILGLCFMVGYLVVLPLGVRYVAPVERLVSRLRLPVPPLDGIILVVAGFSFMLLPRLLGSRVYKLDEIGEVYLGMSWAVFGLVVLTASRASRTAGGSTAPEDDPEGPVAAGA